MTAVLKQIFPRKGKKPSTLFCAEIEVSSPEQSSKLCNIDRPDLMPPRGVHSLKSKPYWIPTRNHGNIVSSCGSGPVR